MHLKLMAMGSFALFDNFSQMIKYIAEFPLHILKKKQSAADVVITFLPTFFIDT